MKPSRPSLKLVLSGVTLWALAAFGAASWLYRPGFPLDDAWIYQTYARTLWEQGYWGYPHTPSGGAATAPLWVVLLIPGHLLPEPGYLIWTWLVGGGVWVILTWRALRAFPYQDAWLWGLAFLFLTEWHLIWAAFSGMETLLFALLVTFSLWEMLASRPIWPLVGLWAGLSIWVRPEGGLLLIPLVWRWFHDEHRSLKDLFDGVYPLAVIVLMYVLFQWIMTGHWLPNTAQAKPAEYAILRELPFWWRWLRMWVPLIVGPGLFLLPSMVVLLVTSARRRRWTVWVGPLWMLAHLSLYAWRLPVIYQHGRYMMPVIPVLLWWGWWGLRELGFQGSHARWRLLHTLWLSSALAVTGVFAFLGVRAYAWDVAFIESEMVDTAMWVRGHLPASQVIAAHDIGALGFFAPQPLIDLAGLVNPEVIPFLRDEQALEAYLVQRQVRYLVTFPSWYRHLDACSEVIFQTQAPFAPQLGGENMTVYRWRPCMKEAPSTRSLVAQVSDTCLPCRTRAWSGSED